MTKVAVIGGSGIYQLDSVEIIREHDVQTPFSENDVKVLEATIKGAPFYFLSRHGQGHYIAPSEINYCANIFALKKLGARVVVSVSAVGSLKQELPPEMVVLPDQFIDWTKGLRRRSFFGEGVVGHVSTANPIEKSLQQRVAKACEQAKVNHSVGGSYICIEGPQFSSKAESEIYRSFGASVIGMTNVPEAYLAKEAAMAYATAAMVTDYDCWKEEHCTLEEILKVMKENYSSAQKMLEVLIPDLNERALEFEPENKFAVVTRPELIASDKKEMLDILLS